VECSVVGRRRDGTIKQDPSSVRQIRKNLLAQAMGDDTRLIFRDPRATELLMQLTQTLRIDKSSPTKNIHGRTPIPEVDEDDAFLVRDVFEIKAHE
jgi:hypothetical protein